MQTAQGKMQSNNGTTHWRRRRIQQIQRHVWVFEFVSFLLSTAQYDISPASFLSLLVHLGNCNIDRYNQQFLVQASILQHKWKPHILYSLSLLLIVMLEAGSLNPCSSCPHHPSAKATTRRTSPTKDTSKQRLLLLGGYSPNRVFYTGHSTFACLREASQSLKNVSGCIIKKLSHLIPYYFLWNW